MMIFGWTRDLRLGDRFSNLFPPPKCVPASEMEKLLRTHSLR